MGMFVTRSTVVVQSSGIERSSISDEGLWWIWEYVYNDDDNDDDCGWAYTDASGARLFTAEFQV